MEQSPSQFRTHQSYRFPDVADHERKTGSKCAPIETDPRTVGKAVALIDTDESTIVQAEAIRARADLDFLCQSVQCRAGLGDPVFFDPLTRSFWVFPAGKALAEKA